ncbi:hypothetical protein DA803_02535 [[Mycoplasma] phocae]|uniref:Lipoprotein n=1 Tax=[Mycoplasma] phocae TaxID=142651 RepID=A0A2Z5ISU7_9BACT|nr:hypothetical protein [[Mycoplasma] phocae]AXE60948.1 hypothetical protein DA803_02535 [[Mycoplasma] phocae]
MKNNKFKWLIIMPTVVASLPLIAASCTKTMIGNSDEIVEGDAKTDDKSNNGPNINKGDVNNGNTSDKKEDNGKKDTNSMKDINAPIDSDANQKIIDEFSKKFKGLDEIKKVIDKMHNLIYPTNNSITDVNTDKYKWLIKDFESINSKIKSKETIDNLSKHLKDDLTTIVKEFSTRIKFFQDALETNIKNVFNNGYDLAHLKSHKKQVQNYLEIENFLDKNANKILEFNFVKLSDKTSWKESIDLLDLKISEIERQQKIVNDFKKEVSFYYDGKLGNESEFWFQDSKVTHSDLKNYQITLIETKVNPDGKVISKYKVVDTTANYTFDVYVEYAYSNNEFKKTASYVNVEDFNAAIPKKQHEDQLLSHIRNDRIEGYKTRVDFKYEGKLGDDLNDLFQKDKIKFNNNITNFEVKYVDVRFQEKNSVAVNYRISLNESSNRKYDFDLYVKFSHGDGPKILGEFITRDQFEKYKSKFDYKYDDKLKLYNLQTQIIINYKGTYTNLSEFKSKLKTDFAYQQKDRYKDYIITPFSFRIDKEKKFFIVEFLLIKNTGGEDGKLYVKFSLDKNQQNHQGVHINANEFYSLPLVSD